MSTAIQWCHIPGYRPETWNPTTGCTSNGAGCDLCYARTLTNRRHKAFKAGKLQTFKQYAHPFSVVQMHPERLSEPLRTRIPTCYFVDSMSDLFHEEIQLDFIDKVFAVMALCPQHLFLILTKRPQRMKEYVTHMDDNVLYDHMDDFLAGKGLNMAQRAIRLPSTSAWPLLNVWLGFSAAKQDEFVASIDHLKNTPAAVRFVSLEPLVAPVSIYGWTHVLDWLICGGESGSAKQKPRPMHPNWPTALHVECAIAGIPFFFKQWGAYVPGKDDDSPERNIVVLDNGRHMPHEEWAGLTIEKKMDLNHNGRSIVMHREGGKHFIHHLNGRVHHNWPPVKSTVPE